MEWLIPMPGIIDRSAPSLPIDKEESVDNMVLTPFQGQKQHLAATSDNDFSSLSPVIA